jgi:hypothetical protein
VSEVRPVSHRANRLRPTRHAHAPHGAVALCWAEISAGYVRAWYYTHPPKKPRRRPALVMFPKTAGRIGDRNSRCERV